MTEVLKILFSVGGSLVMGQIDKATMQNRSNKQMLKMKKDTEEYVDNSMEELYQKLEDNFAKDIRNLMIISRFLLIGFAIILLLLIVLIALLAFNKL